LFVVAILGETVEVSEQGFHGFVVGLQQGECILRGGAI
jgi:hypothetical protein